MTRRAPRPPAAASWLVELFATDGQVESVVGDLSEEFFARKSKSGIASARRWYWRQGVRTVGDLVLAGLCDSPMLITTSVLAGCLLLLFLFAMPERIIVAVIHYREHGVVPYPTNPRTWHLWFQTGIFAGRLTVGLLAGAIAARLSAGREMLGGLSLGVAWTIFMAIFRLSWIVRFWPMGLNIWIVTFLPVTVAVVTGAAIVRVSMLNRARRASHTG